MNSPEVIYQSKMSFPLTNFSYNLLNVNLHLSYKVSKKGGVLSQVIEAFRMLDQVK